MKYVKIKKNQQRQQQQQLCWQYFAITIICFLVSRRTRLCDSLGRVWIFVGEEIYIVWLFLKRFSLSTAFNESVAHARLEANKQAELVRELQAEKQQLLSKLAALEAELVARDNEAARQQTDMQKMLDVREWI